MSSWDFDSFFEWFERLYYGPEKRKKPAEKDPKTDNEREELPKPVATREELLKVLHVTKLDLNIPENTKAHHTDKYHCTEDRVQENGAVEAPELVVRRGQEFTLTLTFDRPFNLEKDDVRLIFKTAGKFAERKESTHGTFDVDETRKVNYEASKWGGKLVRKEGNTATLEVHIDADCAIGEWKIFVETRTKNKEETVKVFTYEHSDDFYILFNPWCKDDTTYMEETDKLNEYILNDHGCIYRGNQYYQEGKEWNFGHFEDGILEASLFIINKCLKPKMKYQLSDPVRVARIIAQVVNCNDADEGVIWGNWTGDYSGGDSPLDWYGSVRILRKYMETRSPVKFGQCWVFSGVATTVCRAVGIPARSVTNFESAHDVDESNTIDMYHHEVIKDGKSVLVKDESKQADTVWNYHVWNEGWFTRPDIHGNDGKYDGWQVFDATPQEESGGISRCGPCPVYAVKNGLVNTPYDCSFIFSEVNADRVYWKATPAGIRPFKIEIDKIGKRISTKVPNGKPYDANAWYDKYQMDITETYKYPDGSEKNRDVVMKATIGARRPRNVFSQKNEEEDVEFKLLHDAELHLGKDVEVKLTAKNVSKNKRELMSVTFRFLRQDYTGRMIGEPFKEDFQGHFFRDDTTLELEPETEREFRVTLTSEEYMPNLDDGRCMNIQAYALVKKTRSRPMQNCVKAHAVEFALPTLEVKLPSSVKKGTMFEAVLTFTNPLQDELTDCSAGYEGGGFAHVTGVKQNNVPAQGTFEGKFQVKAERAGTFTLTFKFTSRQLKHLSGAASVTVQ